MGGRDFRGRFAQHGWLGANRRALRRQGRAIRVQRHLAEEEELGARESSIQECMGFYSGRRRSLADGRSKRNCRCHFKGRRRSRLLDQPAIHVSGPMVASFVLSQLEPSSLPARPGPLRKIDERGDEKRRQRSARACDCKRPNRTIALRDGSLRFSIGRSFRGETQSLFKLGSARRGRRASTRQFAGIEQLAGRTPATLEKAFAVPNAFGISPPPALSLHLHLAEGISRWTRW